MKGTKKRIATITFHASYNYGSCLQAYALQEYIKKILDNECEYNIINLRTDIQKDMYKSFFEKRGIKNIAKTLINIRHINELKEKKQKFEEFIQNNLQITREYISLDELKKQKWDYDYYIAGSDQLWNLQARDFDWANYLEFVQAENKISYAASFGPKPQIWDNQEKDRARSALKEFKYISVREQGSFNNVNELLGIEPQINVDPTMLLDREDWKKLIPTNKSYTKGKYILLYNLKNDKDIFKIARLVSRQLKMPIVVSQYTNSKEIVYGFKKQYNVGPLEFLNLIDNAELILSSSFHGTIFSILLNKPFFAINGLKDFRIRTLLEKMGFEDRSIELDNYKEKCAHSFEINFEKSKELLEVERKKSRDYLKNALDIG